jgi:hypothetical protein
MKRFLRGLGLAALVAGVAGCGDSGPLVHAFEEDVSHGSVLDLRIHVQPEPLHLPAPRLPADATKSELGRLYGIVQGSAEHRKELIDGACKAKDAVELSQAPTVDEAVPPLLSLSGDDRAEVIEEANALLFDDKFGNDSAAAAVTVTCVWAASD